MPCFSSSMSEVLIHFKQFDFTNKVDEYSIMCIYKLLFMLINSKYECNFDGILTNTLEYTLSSDSKENSHINKKTLYFVY